MNKRRPKDALLLAIVKTLCYFQIFSYPLTIHELFKYVHFHKKVHIRTLLNTLRKNPQKFLVEDGYIALYGDGKFLQVRKDRMEISKHKVAKAFWIAHLLKLIPSVRLVGISGSVSMDNAAKYDDIDLFFITSKNTVWITRFLVHMVLVLLGDKRLKKDPLAMDKICPNMFMSQGTLEIPLKLQNIYTAHEVTQMKVLINKDDIYSEFLRSNIWVKSYLPNSFDLAKLQKVHTISKNSVMRYMLLVTEKIFFFSQFLYMRKSITTEIVSSDLLMFHAHPNAKVIQELFDLKVATQARYLEQLQKVKKRLLASITH